jgi:hypothetical protein
MLMWRRRHRPVQRLSNSACRIKDLISQTHIIYHSLNAVQIFYALRHPVRRPCSSRADLEHSTVSLHIECEDMTTAIGEHAGLGQYGPKRDGMLRPNFALVRAGKAIHWMSGMVADHQFIRCIRVLSQHLSQPLSLDVPLTSQTRPHGIDKHQE